MQITIHSTDRTITVNGVPARVWEGETHSGIPVFCCVTRIACPESANQEEFKAELSEHEAPTADAVRVFPLSMLI